MEVLHLYEEYVPFSGINFFPQATLNNAYYVHPLENPLGKTRYIDLSSYCNEIQKEKITELRNIAHSLGAKKCVLESYEEENASTRLSKGGDAKFKIVKASHDANCVNESSRNCSIVFSQEFEGSDHPVKPELKWFAHDTEFNSLIRMRCSEKNRIHKYSIKIDMKSFSAMSYDLASRIDAALKNTKLSAGLTVKKDVENELVQKLLFTIEF